MGLSQIETDKEGFEHKRTYKTREHGHMETLLAGKRGDRLMCPRGKVRLGTHWSVPIKDGEGGRHG
jgi:thiamine phosphate synthase YjbQ (UPF0047 family)